MGFWGSMFGGSNPTLNKAIPQAGAVAGQQLGLGTKLETQAGGWLSDIMSGDTTKIGQILAPETATARQQAQQAKNTMAQFGTRGGGTGSAAASIDASTRGNILNMIAGLTGSAVQTAGSMGENMVDTGMRALNMQVGFSQQQMQNWANSILGQGLSTAAGAAESYGLGKIPGLGSASNA